MRQTTFTKSKISYLGSFGLQGAMFVLARGASVALATAAKFLAAKIPSHGFF